LPSSILICIPLAISSFFISSNFEPIIFCKAGLTAASVSAKDSISVLGKTEGS